MIFEYEVSSHVSIKTTCRSTVYIITGMCYAIRRLQRAGGLCGKSCDFRASPRTKFNKKEGCDTGHLFFGENK